MIAVADTSPVCYLILIGEIDLLPKLFSQVLVPEAVLAELLHEDGQGDAWFAVRKTCPRECGHGSLRGCATECALPDRLDLGGPDLPVAADERRSQRNRGGGHNPIRQIRNLKAAHELKGIGDRAVEGRQQTWNCRVIQCVDQPFTCRARQTALLDQAG